MNLKEKQDKELKELALISKDEEKYIDEKDGIHFEFSQNEIEEFLDKVRKETRGDEREKIKQNIGLLRQWLNERTDSMELITNKELETFLLK